MPRTRRTVDQGAPRLGADFYALDPEQGQMFPTAGLRPSPSAPATDAPTLLTEPACPACGAPGPVEVCPSCRAAGHDAPALFA